MGVPRESRRNTDTQAHANLQLRDVDGILVRSRALHPDMQRCFLAAFVHVVDTDSASDSNVARRGKAAQPRARRPSRLACRIGAARSRGYRPRRRARDGRRCPQHAGCVLLAMCGLGADTIRSGLLRRRRLIRLECISVHLALRRMVAQTTGCLTWTGCGWNAWMRTSEQENLTASLQASEQAHRSVARPPNLEV